MSFVRPGNEQYRVPLLVGGSYGTSGKDSLNLIGPNTGYASLVKNEPEARSSDLNMGASSQQNGGRTRKNNRRNRNQRRNRNNRRNCRSQKNKSCRKQRGGSYVKSLFETRSGYGYSNGTLAENRLYAGAHPKPTPLRAHGQEQGGGKRIRTRKNRNNRRNRRSQRNRNNRRNTRKNRRGGRKQRNNRKNNRRNNRRNRNQRGGAAGAPYTPSYSVAGSSLSKNDSMLANPPPTTSMSNCGK